MLPRRHFRQWIFCATFCVAFFSAAPQSIAAGRVHDAEALTGIVLNQTRSEAGNTFFLYFCAAWREQDLRERYSLVLEERSTSGGGKRLRFLFRQQAVYELQLPPRGGDFKELSEQVAYEVYQHVSDAEVAHLLFRDVELAADEI